MCHIKEGLFRYMLCIAEVSVWQTTESVYGKTTCKQTDSIIYSIEEIKLPIQLIRVTNIIRVISLILTSHDNQSSSASFLRVFHKELVNFEKLPIRCYSKYLSAVFANETSKGYILWDFYIIVNGLKSNSRKN